MGTTGQKPSTLDMSKELKIFARQGYIDVDKHRLFDTCYEQAGMFVNGLANVKDGRSGKWGYINTKGESVLQPQYDNAHCFNKDYHVAPVELEGKWGLIDRNGNWVFEPRFEGLYFDIIYSSAHEKMLRAERNGLLGCVDLGGNWVIQPRWEWMDTSHLYDGLILVQDPETSLYGFIDLTNRMVLEPQLKDEPKYGIGHIVASVPNGDDEKYGVLDMTGHWMIEPRFDDMNVFSARHGIATARKDGLWGVIDREGRWVCEPKFDSIGSFDNGFCLAPAEIDGRYGYINPQGEWVIEPQYHWADDFEDRSGLAVVCTRNRYGCIDNKGRFAIEPKFVQLLWGFEESTGLCHVSGNGKDYYIDRHGNRADYSEPEDMPNPAYYPKIGRFWGIKDGEGNIVVPPTFDQIYGFDKRGRASATMKGKCGVIDESGRWIIEPLYDTSHILPYEEGELSLVSRDGKYGFMDFEGVEAIPCQFDYAKEFEEETGLAPAWVHEKCGLIDRDGHWRVQPINDDIEIRQGIIKVERDGLWGTVDMDGNMVIPCQFDRMSDYNVDLDRWVVEKDFLQGYCDGKGNIVIPIQFDEVQPFHSKTPVAAVRVGALWGMIDDNGNWLCKPQFGDIDNYFDPDDGPIPVAKEDKCGYVDIYGNEVLPFIFKYLYGFDRKGDGTAECTLLDGREVLIDRTGNILKYLDNDNT